MGATPFETPETLPSRLETEGDDEEEEEITSVTPPLTYEKVTGSGVNDWIWTYEKCLDVVATGYASEQRSTGS
nr:hypothetical protein [Tanacetum cinerariifolium]